MWNFDGKPIDRYFLGKLGASIRQYGPDEADEQGRGGPGEYVNENFGMIYRPFHTNKESRMERQPYVTRCKDSGAVRNVMTWDGRLDNRDELMKALHYELSNEHSRTLIGSPTGYTDVAIVMAAWEAWGTDCFKRFIGDFSLAVWNRQNKTLTLAKDFIGVRYLYYEVLPEGVRGSFDGNAGDLANKAGRRQLLMIAGALAAMYIVLGVLYESLAHPLTIISTLPSAGLGALLALQVTNTPLTIIAFVGIILLIGIVKKNGIMIVDFALDAERHRGLSSADAIFEACSARFRPILMTTMAALFAGIPLVIATGPGTELRRPLGITIIGGLFVSQILTLYTTPVIYLLIDRLRRRSEPAAIEAPAE